MISLNKVGVERDGQRILCDITISMSEPRIGVIGRNGSGKSTFARLLNGLLRPSHGTISVGGTADPAQFRRQVGFVFQNPDNQIVYPNVAEDLAFGLRSLKLSNAEQSRRIDRVLRALNITHLRDRPSHKLSGGEKQLIALAGVLIMAPGTIVLDEPTTLLDLANTERFLAVLNGLEQQVILVTHDLETVGDFDRVLLIEAGRLIADGQPDAVIAQYRALVRNLVQPC